MNELMNEVPEAKMYCETVIQNIARYRLFEGEQFDSYAIGVMATSEVDHHGDMLTPAALDALVSQIASKSLWMFAEHDLTIPPLGRTIAAKRFYAPSSKVYFVCGVSGVYSVTSYRSFAEVGVTPREPASPELPSSMPESPTLAIRLAASPIEIDIPWLQQLVSDAPNSVERVIDYNFRKAADPLTTIITFVLPTYLLLKTPFLSKYGERLGEAAADATIGFLRWVRDKLAHAISSKVRRRVLYEIRSFHHGSQLILLIDSSDPTVVYQAVDSIEGAAASAINLIENLQHLEPKTVAYVFDHRKTKRWIPTYAVTTKNGVITDTPRLISVEKRGGFSIAGGANPVEHGPAPTGDSNREGAVGQEGDNQGS